jgi:hypothetical protein
MLTNQTPIDPRHAREIGETVKTEVNSAPMASTDDVA